MSNIYIVFSYLCMYLGMTELGGAVVIQNSAHKDGSCGIVSANTEIKIVDPENGTVLGPNQTGEIWIKSDTIMNGYYKNPEATKEVIDKEGERISFSLLYE